MRRRIVSRLTLALLLLATGAEAAACSLCGGGLQRSLTMREEARYAKIVVVGTLENPRLTPGGNGLSGGGATDLRIEKVLKTDPALKGKEVLTIPRYIPVDAKKPARFLVFCDVFEGKIDPYRGTPVRGDALLPYLAGAIGQPEKDRTKSLLYFYRHLDAADPDVAADAFLEFAKASDRDVGEVARHLDPGRLRKLLTDPKTPPERLGVFAFLAGACGGDAEADLLARMIREDSERSRAALSGLLSGYIELRPSEGWELALRILSDEKRKFSERLAVLGTVRFFQGWKPQQVRDVVLRAMGAIVPQGDMADLAVEDLRRWKWWDLTGAVLAQYGKETHSSPLVRRAIVRYALSCPRPEAKEFVARLARSDPKLVAELKQALEFETPSDPASR
ncbi:MAG TPA: hypothetical protein VIL46_11905 [Gemmataceae bacterium]